MKKKYRKMAPDSVTRLFGTALARQTSLLRDQDKGPLRTVFAQAVYSLHDDVMALHRAALASNSIIVDPLSGGTSGYMDSLDALIEATEARSSDAASDVRAFRDFITACEAARDKMPEDKTGGLIKGFLRECRETRNMFHTAWNL